LYALLPIASEHSFSGDWTGFFYPQQGLDNNKREKKMEAKKKDLKWIFFGNLVRESSGEFDRMIMDLDLTILNLLAKNLNSQSFIFFALRTGPCRISQLLS